MDLETEPITLEEAEERAVEQCENWSSNNLSVISGKRYHLELNLYSDYAMQCGDLCTWNFWNLQRIAALAAKGLQDDVDEIEIVTDDNKEHYMK